MVLQRPTSAGESNLRPRNIVPIEQFYFQTFRTRAELLRVKTGAIHQLHLTDARNGIDRQQSVENNVALRLFTGLASRALLRGFIFFQISSGQRPQALARFDRATTKQKPVAMRNNRAHNDFWICVMYMATRIAHVSFRRVSIRHTANETRIGWQWCGAMTGHSDNSAQQRMQTEAQIRIFALPTHAQTR